MFYLCSVDTPTSTIRRYVCRQHWRPQLTHQCTRDEPLKPMHPGIVEQFRYDPPEDFRVVSTPHLLPVGTKK